jgi:hypothetical protein
MERVDRMVKLNYYPETDEITAECAINLGAGNISGTSSEGKTHLRNDLKDMQPRKLLSS